MPVDSDTPGSDHLSIVFVTVFIANRRIACRMTGPMSVVGQRGFVPAEGGFSAWLS